ncbi:MAG: hypothetical protein AAB468_00125 [Patescibacteria group bacterium]
MSKSCVIVDVGNDGVSGAVVNLSTGKDCAQFLSTVHEPVPSRDNFELKRFLDDVFSAFKTVINRLGTPSSRLVIFLASPFYASQTRIIRWQKAAPINISRSLVNQLVGEDRERFRQAEPRLYTEIINDRHEIVDGKIMQIKLNRYATANPYGQKASEIEIDNYISIGSTKILDRLRQIAQPLWHRHRLEFHSSSFVFFNLFRDWWHDVPRALLLNIGGEVTELSLVTDGVLAETVSYPLGRNSFFRQLTARLGTILAEAESLMKMYVTTDQHEAAAGKVEAVLGEIRVEWLAAFRELLRAISDNHFLADRIFLLADPVLAPVLASWIKESNFSNLVMMNRPSFEVIMFYDQAWRKLCRHGEKIIPGHYLLMDALFCDKISKVV